jgi:peptide/nickel transport system permease protein
VLTPEPSLAVYPGLAIATAVLGLNLLGDGLRDLFDPRLSRER